MLCWLGAAAVWEEQGGSFTCFLGLEFGFSWHFCAPHLHWARQILVHERQGLNQGFSFLFHGLCCLKILPLECDFPPPPLHFIYFFFLFAELLSPAAASEHVLLPWARGENLSLCLPVRTWCSCNLYSNLVLIWHPRCSD